MDPNADDLALLELLKQAEPAIITVSGDALYAAASSIPPEVLEAFEALTPSVGYVKVGTVWCLDLGDWLSCRDRLISKLMARMSGRSLELGIIGPTRLCCTNRVMDVLPLTPDGFSLRAQ